MSGSIVVLALLSPLIANQSAYQRLIGDVGEEAAQAITEVFLRDSRARIQRMLDRAGGQDFMALGREAHALKGSVDMLGFERLTFVSSMLEIAGKEGAAEPELAQLVDSLKTEFAEVERLCLERLGKAA